MAGKIRLLDCTLRDGGYVNDWNFGNGAMTCIFDRLNEAGVDIIEIGFLDQRQPFDVNRTIQPGTECLSEAFSGISKKRSKIVAMIDYGTCDLERIQPRSQTQIDGIRVIFKKDRMYDAIAFGKSIMEKGYELFLQMVSITSYDDEDVIEFSAAVNEIRPFAVSVVDTYGLMHKEQMFRYFELLDKYLHESISIGYHSHNNFQLAYANTIEMLKLETNRDLIADGTLYGMGKSAGNAPLELLAMHLNENYGKEYDINQILEAIDINILPMYEKHYWGYGLLFYVSAKSDCHPSYVQYLMDKRTLSIKAVNEILEMVPAGSKLNFSKPLIEELYMEYLLDNVDDSAFLEYFYKELQNKELLLIGPGASATDERNRITEYLKEKSPVVIAVNFVPQNIDADHYFINNPKRYALMVPHINSKRVSIIATSNVTPISEPFDHVVEYGKLVSETDEIWDNALVIILNLLRKVGVRSVSLAGFDGFKKETPNYVDSRFDLSKNFDYLSAVNSLLTRKIKEYRKDMKISFLTRSIYEE